MSKRKDIRVAVIDALSVSESIYAGVHDSKKAQVEPEDMPAIRVRTGPDYTDSQYKAMGRSQFDLHREFELYFDVYVSGENAEDERDLIECEIENVLFDHYKQRLFPKCVNSMFIKSSLPAVDPNGNQIHSGTVLTVQFGYFDKRE